MEDGVAVEAAAQQFLEQSQEESAPCGRPALVAGFAVEGIGQLGIGSRLEPGLELFEEGMEVSHGT